MTQSDLLLNIQKLFEVQKLGVLATAGTSYPYTSLMTFAVTQNLQHIIFATLRKTTKYSNMVANKYVSFLVDSSLNQANDLKDAIAVTALGQVSEATDAERSGYQKLLIKKNQDIEGFLNNADCAIMAFKVDEYIYVDRFEKVKEIKM